MEAESIDRFSKSLFLFFNFQYITASVVPKRSVLQMTQKLGCHRTYISVPPDVLPNSLILSSLLESTPEHSMKELCVT